MKEINVTPCVSILKMFLCTLPSQSSGGQRNLFKLRYGVIPVRDGIKEGRDGDEKVYAQRSV